MLYRFTVLTVMACLLGTLVSLAAIGFVEGVRWLNDVLLVSHRSRIQFTAPAWLALVTVAVPTIGGLVVGSLLQRATASKRQLGPADVIRSTQLRTALPPAKDGVVSTSAALISLGCGASVGQYGPLVYLGALAGSQLDRLRLAIPNAPAVAVACGVAAAISTAFNAPIAGLVFAHEVILRHYSLQAFAPTTVASATGFVVANVIFERPPLFLVAFDGVEHGYEFALFGVLGVACALLAVLFVRLVLAAGRLASRTPLPPALRPALAGLIVGLVALELPDVLGIGTEALRFATIEGAFDQHELALLIVAKLVLTALCIGFGFAGGVFSPSLLIGILAGALFGNSLVLLGVPVSSVAVYAISGMMAMASPVIGAPLTTILIVFELTRNYELTIAAMVSVVFANLLAFRLIGRSLFDIQLAASGVDLSAGRDRAQLEHACILDHVDAQPLVVSEDMTVKQATRKVSEAQRGEAIVIDAQGRLLGMFRLQDVTHAPHGRVAEVMQRNGLCLDENTSLWKAMNLLHGFVGEILPVTDSSSGQLLGSITEGAVISAYLSTVHAARSEEHEAL